jgi:serine/threonine protein kinase
VSKPCFSEEQVLAKRFRIERLLGAGGMGEVYLARDLRLEERVALKTIRRRLSAEPAIRRQFVAEVQNARRVTHPNVCRIYELFDDDEIPFLVMEYLDGPTLSEWLKSAKHSAIVCRKIALNLAEGLSAAHAQGIIHRDFKPDNVILTGSEQHLRAVITDFGLARPFSEPDDPRAKSLGGGTRDYMAPELHSGASASVASDLYAFGVVLGELVPKHPFATECKARNPERRPKSLDSAIRQWRSNSSRRWWMLAWLAGPAAAVAAYEWMSRPRLAFTSRQRLLLNGFAPSSDIVSRTVRDLLMTGLRQSPLVTVVPDERVRVLSGGNWPERLDQLISIAGRAQIPFVLQGSLQHTASDIRLLVEVLDTLTGKLALRLSESGDAKRLVTLTDRMALQLRRDFGESENSLRATYRSLSEVTSSSPEAAEAYFQGLHFYESSDAVGALTWFDRALEIDPQFALAHLGRALALQGQNRESEALASHERAFQLRARISERERLWIESQYANTAAQDFAAAVNTLRRMVHLFPEEAIFQRQLSLAYSLTGQPEQGIEAAHKAVELNSLSANNRNVLICTLAQAGHSDEAIDYFKQCRSDGVSSHLLERGLGLAYMGKGDYDAALAAFRRMLRPAELEREGKIFSTGPLVMLGRFEEAAQQLSFGLSSDSNGGPSRNREAQRLALAHVYWLMDQSSTARARALETAQLEPIPINLPFLAPAAGVASLLRDSELLSEIRDRVSRIAVRWPSSYSQGMRAMCEGLAYWATNDERSAATFQDARGLWPDPLTLFWYARWAADQNDFATALATYEQLRAASGTLLRYHFAGLSVLSWIDEARCLQRLSRYGESLRLYKKVLDHWERHAGLFNVTREVRGEHDRVKGAKRDG